MARRQTYREGPSTTDEYDVIFDSDPAEHAPYYNKRYEAHLYQTEQEKAQEIFRLLRALSEHLDAQDKSTLSLETAGATRHISQREHTVAMKTKEKLHIYKDVNLIPDRGKKPNESIIAKTKHEELSPELNDFCTYE